MEWVAAITSLLMAMAPFFLDPPDREPERVERVEVKDVKVRQEVER